MISLNQLTVVILTFNRYEKLLRLLRYIESSNYSFPLFILDSSSEPNPGDGVSELVRRLHIQHIRYDSSISPIDKICNGLMKVTTPYVVLWADDDFLVLNTLPSGIEFLERNKDFVMVHGKAAKFNAQGDAGRKNLVVDSFSHYEMGKIDYPTAAERLRHHLTYYTITMYSIHRVEVLRRSMELTRDHGFGYGFGEIVPSCLSLINGKAKQLSQLYLVKEVHDQNSTWGTPIDLFEWITSHFFAKDSKAMIEVLGKEIAAVDKISLSDAKAIVKQAFWKHVGDRMKKRCPDPNGSQSKMREGLKQINFLHWLWMYLRSLSWRKRDRFLLPALRRKSSPYHQDFQQIYRCLKP